MNKAPNSRQCPLDDGEPCKRHGCVKCCLETRMPLTDRDIRRIQGLGYKVGDFAVGTSGKWRLKNKNGRCVFLSEGGCGIYPYRPEGCRLYPLVYNEEEGEAGLDEFCPYRHEFMVRESDIEKLKALLERLNAERRKSV